jgi:PPOX class probable F420-dependent enzyme
MTTPARPRVQGHGPRREHLEEFARHRFAVMTTVHPDGRSQLSLVQQHAHDGVLDVSLTGARVKTRNLRRDPRAALMILPAGTSRFVVAEGRAELSDVSRVPGDDVGRALAALYEALAGPHPDWDDYFRAMVEDRRLLCRVHVEHTYAGGA